MTSEGEILRNLTKADQWVKTAGNQELHCIGIGEATLKTLAGDIELRRVMYIPDISENLLCLEALVDAGVEAHWTKAKVVLKLDDGGIISYPRFSGRNRTHIKGKHIVVRENASAVTPKEIAALEHEKLGHPGAKHHLEVSKHYPDQPEVKVGDLPDCEPCVVGKSTKAKLPSHSTEPKATQPLERLHIDIMHWTPSTTNYKFALVIVDDFTSLVHVHPITNKSHALQALIDFTTLAEKQTERKVKIIRSDNDGVFTSNQALDWRSDNGILWELTTPHDSRGNGKVERMIRTMKEKTTSNLVSRNIPTSLWPEAIEYSALQFNLIPRDGSVPFEAFWGRSPDRLLKFLQPFGCLAWAYIPESKRQGGKTGPKALPAIFVGLSQERRGWKLYSPHASPTTFWTNSVRFYPTKQWSDRREFASWRELVDHPVHFALRETDIGDLTYDPIDIIATEDKEAIEYYESGLTNLEGEADIELDEDRLQRLDDEEAAYTVDLTKKWIPFNSALAASAKETEHHQQSLTPSVKEALSGPDALRWRQAIKSEIGGLQDMGTWEEVDAPDGALLVDSKLVLRIKTDANGIPVKYKARLVARGFTQREGLDFEETFAPVAPFTAIRALLAMAAKNRWHIHCTDFSQAYLNGTLDHAIYMKPPAGLELPSGKVFKVVKGLYGLKQSGRVWNQELDRLLRKIGFMPTASTPSIYSRGTGNEMVVVIAYVDDLAIASPNLEQIETIKDQLGRTYKLEDKGPVDSFCGIKIDYNRDTGRLAMSQRSFTTSLVEEFANEAKPAKTPMDVIPKHGEPIFEIKHDYQRLVGKLLWLSNHTRPDITFPTGVLARHMSAPSREAMDAAIRVVRYLKYSNRHELVYDANARDSSSPLLAYSDANWASDKNTDMKSTSGSAIYLYGGLVAWKTQLQKSVALSAVESELIAGSEAARELLFVKTLLEELGIELYPVMLTDSQGCIQVSKDPVQHWKLKHVATRYHFLRDNVQSKAFEIKYVPTTQNPADTFTKPLG